MNPTENRVTYQKALDFIVEEMIARGCDPNFAALWRKIAAERFVDDTWFDRIFRGYYDSPAASAMLAAISATDKRSVAASLLSYEFVSIDENVCVLPN